MIYKTLVFAEVTEEASIVQVHNSVLLPSNVHIHGQPVISQVSLKRPEKDVKDFEAKSEFISLGQYRKTRQPCG